MNKQNTTEIKRYSGELFTVLSSIIEQAKSKAAVFVVAESTLMYWQIGDYINTYLKTDGRTEYGGKILASLSQQLALQSKLQNKTPETMKHKYCKANLLSNFLTELGYEG